MTIRLEPKWSCWAGHTRSPHNTLTLDQLILIHTETVWPKLWRSTNSDFGGHFLYLKLHLWLRPEWQLRRRRLWEAHWWQRPDNTGAHGVYAAGLPHWIWRWTGRRTYLGRSWLGLLAWDTPYAISFFQFAFIPMISPWYTYPYFWLNHPWQPKRNISAGETVFYAGNGTKEVLRVVPNTGMALVHRHGRECLLHESLPVRSGVKQPGAKQMDWFQGKSAGMNSCCSLLSSGRFRFSCRFCLKPLGNAWLMRKGSQKTLEIGGMVGISGVCRGPAEFTASDQIVLGDVDED